MVTYSQKCSYGKPWPENRYSGVGDFSLYTFWKHYLCVCLCVYESLFRGLKRVSNPLELDWVLGTELRNRERDPNCWVIISRHSIIYLLIYKSFFTKANVQNDLCIAEAKAPLLENVDFDTYIPISTINNKMHI